MTVSRNALAFDRAAAAVAAVATAAAAAAAAAAVTAAAAASRVASTCVRRVVCHFMIQTEWGAIAIDVASSMSMISQLCPRIASHGPTSP